VVYTICFVAAGLLPLIRTLSISQVNILTKIFSGETDYSSDSIKILKTIMRIDNNDGIELYGKTGSGTKGNAWFIGFFEKNASPIYFAVYLEDEEMKNVTGSNAKSIAFLIINTYYNN
jgi:bla regulator protein BlaR1